MSNQISELLASWYPQRDDQDWVLGVIYKTAGPCYRKTGAMMLFNSLGQQFGMLSGGCLESDIQTHARRVMQTGEAMTLCYDATDEDDMAFQLGIGCGGTVHILLRPILKTNDYLHLPLLWQRLQARENSHYRLCLDISVADSVSEVRSVEAAPLIANNIMQQHHEWLSVSVDPEPHIFIAGGGVDARPVVAMAKLLGWQVTVWDPRPANARREFFMQADHILDCPVEHIPNYLAESQVSGAILMTHNITLDAAVLAAIQTTTLTGLRYLALLGPANRRADVLQAAGLIEPSLFVPVHGPAGLDIGGELPESIALSMLSQCHQVLMNKVDVGQPKIFIVGQSDEQAA